MAISYPLTPPTKPGYKRSRWAGRNVVGEAVSPFTLQSQQQLHQGEIWVAELTLPPMLRAQAEEWNAFRLALRGSSGSFLLGDPDAKTPRGTAAGTPLVNGAGQTGLSLVTDGWAVSQTVLKMGDYIQIGTGASSRLYKVLTDTVSNGSGQATLDIWPRLREGPADNAAIITSNCVGLFQLVGNEQGWDTDELRHYGITFACREKI